MRNIQKHAEQGKKIINKHPKSDLTARELTEMLDAHKGAALSGEADAVIDAILTAFNMGVAVGARIKA